MWFLLAAVFGLLGAAVIYVCWIAHATTGCRACYQRALLRPAWTVVRTLIGTALWTRGVRLLDHALLPEFPAAVPS